MRGQIIAIALSIFLCLPILLIGNGSNAAPVDEKPEELAQDRRRPGEEDKRPLPEIDPTSVAPPARSLPRETLPVPDRWRLVEAIGVNERWWDPYNQNTLKADRPLFDDWFLNLLV
ncbi:MAG: hypothetical protein ACPHGY_08680, partial [Rhodospirillaceae bacterium]